MGGTLHIVTRDDELTREVRRASAGENGVSVADLTAEAPDYAELLKAIFAAERVHSW